jgi:hypothetical protein
MTVQRLIPLTVLALTSLALPGTAGATSVSQAVTGTTLASAISVGVPTPATFGVGLGPAAGVDSTGGAVAVTAIGPWTMRVSGTDSGRLHAGAGPTCTGSTTLLGNPLDLFATAALGNFNALGHTSSAPLQLTGTSTPIASGTGTNTVNLTYRFSPASTDQLTAGCDYSLTATVDVSAS